MYFQKEDAENTVSFGMPFGIRKHPGDHSAADMYRFITESNNKGWS